MSVWVLIQICSYLVMIVGMVVMWSKLKKPPQDDPRLSRGLQLLQSKISVLEDLSDRTEVQVKQLTTLLEQKGRQLQQKIQEAQEQIHAVERSMKKSLEVAEIFQDKIPHEEIIERQNTVKYVQAARMAHQGYTVEEIMEKVDLPRSEVEFIAKVNKDQLMFNDQMLPEWAKKPLPSADELVEEAENWSINETEIKAAPRMPNLADAFQVPQTDMSSLKKIGEEFREACRRYEEEQKKIEAPSEASQIFKAASRITEKIIDKAGQFLSNEKETTLASAKFDSGTTDKGQMATESSDSIQSETAREIGPDLVSEMAQSAQNKEIANAAVGMRTVQTESGSATRTASSKTSGINRTAGSTKIEMAGDKTHVVPSSYLKTELKVNKNESKVVSSEAIKKVVFPRVDVTNNLG